MGRICANCSFSEGEGTILFCKFHGGKAIRTIDTCDDFVGRHELKFAEAVEVVPEVVEETIGRRKKKVLDIDSTDS